MPQTLYRGTHEQARRLIGQLVQQLAGKGGTLPAEVVRGLQLRCGVALLSQIQLAFVVKSRGGTGNDGVKWKPLKPETIARRKRTAKDVAGGKRAIKAARRAGQKKPTVVELYGSREVEILIDTRVMFRSLSPAILDRAPIAADMGAKRQKDDIGEGNENQIFQTPPGQLIVGTVDPKASTHQRGRGAVPARPLWPADGILPPPWQQAVSRALEQGLVRAVLILMERGQRPGGV